ncbi:MAG: SusC/RagA family TonB-linked outer membrane protein [Coprobacter sp.]|nr:SusC/RagA family TonB-linked outer membrane protein [Coprobacter sp.]
MKKHDRMFYPCWMGRFLKSVGFSFLLWTVFSGNAEASSSGYEKKDVLDKTAEEPLAAAQAPQTNSKKITGVVTDEEGEPLAGVVVSVEKTKIVATTDLSGLYTISVPDGTTALTFNFVGMEKQVVSLKNKTRINVVMRSKTELKEVVVTGYQTIDKRHSTSAITSVKAEDVLIPGMTSIDQALEGRIPELLFTANSGEVGATGRIRVRGTSTIIGNREPLWVLDGFIMHDPVNVSPDELNDPDYINIVGNAIAGINPQDIERIDVLKDASATALYGTKAANGVIVVTTKKGSIGKPRFSYNHTSKYTARPRYTDRAINLMNSSERVQFGKELVDLHYQFPQNMPLVGYEGAAYKYYTGQTTWDEFQAEVRRYETSNTDWFGLLTQDAYSNDHTFGVSGGSEAVRYYVSLGADFERGVSKTTSTKRYTALANFDITFSDKVRANFSMNGNVQNRNNLYDSNALMDYAYNTSRTIPAYNEDGSYFFYKNYAYGTNVTYTPFNYNILNELDNSSNIQRSSMINANLTLQYDIIKGLQLSVAGNYMHSTSLSELWWGEQSHYVARLRNAEYGEVPRTGDAGRSILPYGGILKTSNSEADAFTFRTQIEYRKLFGQDNQHLITAMGGYEMNGSTYRTIDDETRGYLRDRGMKFVEGIDLEDFPRYAEWLNKSHRTLGHNIEHELSGYLSTSYSFKEYFTVNMNGRFDASNKFGDRSNERFLPIWSLSGMWNVKRTFLQRVDPISDFRIRASYGTQGNMLDSQSPNLVIQQGTTNPMYNENVSYVARYPNPNLKWEVTRQWNLSADLSMFNHRLGISGTLYFKRTTDCFTTVNVSSVNGLSSYVMNGGDLENKGYSVSLSATPIQNKDWRWSLSTYFSGNLNRVYTNNAESYTISHYLTGMAVIDGESIGTFYSYAYQGLNPLNGVPLFDDYADRVHLLEGKSLEQIVKMTMTKSGQRDPLFSGSFSTSLTWKKLSFSMNLSYNLGSKVRLFALYAPIYGSNGLNAEANVRKEFLNRWMAPGDEAYTDIPTILSPSDPDYSNYLVHYSQAHATVQPFASSVWDMYDKSDLRVVSGSYMKCTSMSIRYSLENKWLKNTPFSNVMVSLSGMNLFTVSAKALRGQDPSQAGFAKPNLSVRPSYTLNVNLSF